MTGETSSDGGETSGRAESPNNDPTVRPEPAKDRLPKDLEYIDDDEYPDPVVGSDEAAIQEMIATLDLAGQGQPPPLSPWSEHFGFRDQEPNFFGENHSWVAPREPSSGPSGPSGPTGPSGGGSPPDSPDYTPKSQLNPQDYDAVFLSERLQVSRFKGLRTREAQIFAQPDTYQPPEGAESWAENWVNTRQITVNEANHLTIFKKFQWIGYFPVSPMATSLPGHNTPEFGNWTVVHEPLWKELTLCIELADRILKHSFQGPWMQALLYRPDLFERFQQDFHDDPAKTINIIRGRDKPTFVLPWPYNALGATSFNPSGASGQEGNVNYDDEDDPMTALDVEAQLERVEKEAQSPSAPTHKSPPQAPKPWIKEPPSTRVSPFQKGHFVSYDWTDDEANAYFTAEQTAAFISWTFFDTKYSPSPAQVNDTMLYRVKGMNENNKRCVIELNVDAIRPLLDPNTSHMERILAVNMVAITMVRGFLRAIQVGYQNNGFSNLSFEDEKVIDLSSSFENAVFGGKIKFPFYHDPAEARKGNSLILTGSDFPTTGDIGRFSLLRFEDEKLYHTVGFGQADYRSNWHSYPIPGIWPLRLLSNSFWEVEVPRFSRGTLYFPKNFRAKEHRGDKALGSHHLETRTYSAKFRPSLREGEHMASLNKALQAKRAETASLRPWYWDAYYKWQITPYSLPETRWLLKQINNWSPILSKWDEFRVQEVTRYWLSKPPSFNGAPLAWFYSAIADLIVACLPLKGQDVYVGAGRVPQKNSSKQRPRRPFTLAERGPVERQKSFVRAWNKFDFYFQNRPHDSGLRNSINALLRHMWNEIDNHAYYPIQFRFALPRYDDDIGGMNWEHPDTNKVLWSNPRIGRNFIQIGGVSMRPGLLTQYAASVADAEEKLMRDLPEYLKDSVFDRRVDEPRWDPKQPVWGRLNALTGGDRGTSTNKHFTVGEIMEHVLDDELWVLKEEGEDIAIYDISAATTKRKLTSEQLDEMLEPSEYGYVLNRKGSKQFGSEHVRKVGYVVQWMHEADVAERDGQDGRPIWITLGLDVFNLTGFNYSFSKVVPALSKADRKDLKAVLESKPGGSPMPALVAHETLRTKINPIRELLAHSRVGRLRENKTPATSDLIFTREEVGWYAFKETGLYTIIGEDVYDMTDYMEFHPGGKQILQKAGGRDSTETFMESHSDTEATLRENQHLRIGRVVHTVPNPKPLAEDEFEFNSHIYKLTGKLGQRVKQYFGGKVITEEFLSESQAYFYPLRRVPLESIWRWRNLGSLLTRPKNCIAKRERSKKLKEITPEELKMCDGDEGDDWYNEGWMAVGDDVYNMTTVLRYAENSLRSRLKPFAGNTVWSQTVRDFIKKEYPFRKIAKLPNRPRGREGGRSPGTLQDGTVLVNKPKLLFKGLSQLGTSTPAPESTQTNTAISARQAHLKRNRSPSPPNYTKRRALSATAHPDIVQHELTTLRRTIQHPSETSLPPSASESLTMMDDHMWKLMPLAVWSNSAPADRQRRGQEERHRTDIETERATRAEAWRRVQVALFSS